MGTRSGHKLRPLALAACCAFAPLQDDNAVAVIDPADGKVIARTQVAKGPAGIAASPDGRFVYLTHPEAGRISVIDTESFALAHEWPFAGAPFGAAVSPDGGRLAVSDWNGDVVALVDAHTGARLAQTPVGRSPAGVAVDAALGRVYTANRESNTISVLSLDKLEHIATVPVGAAPFALAIAPSGGQIFAANVRGADVSIIDPRTFAVTSVSAGGKSPYGLATLADSRFVAINQQSGTAAVIDAARREILATIKIGRYPEGAAAAPDGHSVWVANWFSGDVSVIDMRDYREIRRTPVGGGPRTVIFANRFKP